MIEILLCVVFLIVLHYYLEYSAKRCFKTIPVPEGLFFIGNGKAVFGSQVELFNLGRRYARKFNGIYGFRSLTFRTINLYNPEDIETVISTSKNSEKSVIYKFLRPWLNEGLLVSKGAKWAHRRKILTPTFHFNILKRFVTTMEDNSRVVVEKIAKTGGEPVNVVPIISDYTLNAICETAMGTRLDEEKSKKGSVYKKALQQLVICITARMARLYYFHDPIFHLSTIARNFYKHLKIIKSFTKKIIEERKVFVEVNGINFAESLEDDDDEVYLKSKKKKVAMLDLMLSAEKEGIIDSDGIQEEVDTFMFEGHDTTASGLDHCLMSIANDKSIQDKILIELNGIFGDSDRQATVEDLNSMKYLECCIKESLRLYPPVPFIGRILSKNVVLGGVTMPEGISCHIHIFDLHRRADIYPEPERFDPDRFLPENSAGRHPYAFIPFSAGPRNCIGQRFAMFEMKSCVSSILRKFALHPVTRPEDLEFAADLVLRNTKPVYIKFMKRC